MNRGESAQYGEKMSASGGKKLHSSPGVMNLLLEARGERITAARSFDSQVSVVPLIL